MSDPAVREDPAALLAALEAERARRERQPKTTPELIGDLVRALHSLYRTPPDNAA